MLKLASATTLRAFNLWPNARLNAPPADPEIKQIRDLLRDSRKPVLSCFPHC